jgi:hypothetical protein
MKFTTVLGGLLVLLLMSAALPTVFANEGEVKPLSITMEGYDYARYPELGRKTAELIPGAK